MCLLSGTLSWRRNTQPCPQEPPFSQGRRDFSISVYGEKYSRGRCITHVTVPGLGQGASWPGCAGSPCDVSEDSEERGPSHGHMAFSLEAGSDPLRVGPGPQAETPDAGPRNKIPPTCTPHPDRRGIHSMGPTTGLPRSEAGQHYARSQELGWGSRGSHPPRVGWALAALLLGLAGLLCSMGSQSGALSTALFCVSLRNGSSFPASDPSCTWRYGQML